MGGLAISTVHLEHHPSRLDHQPRKGLRIIRSRITLCCGFLVPRPMKVLAGWIVTYPLRSHHHGFIRYNKPFHL